MRSLKDIETELLAAQGKCAALQCELDQANFALFLQERGVPVGARPVFETKQGDRVLVDRATHGSSMRAEGFLIKKDGSVSSVRRHLYGDQFWFVGD